MVKEMIRSCLLLLALLRSLTFSKNCSVGWFGKDCNIACHCADGLCNANGTCRTENGCKLGYFGLSCQFEDLAIPGIITAHRIPTKLLNDNNDGTCIKDSAELNPTYSNIREVVLTRNNSFPLRRLRIHVDTPGLQNYLFAIYENKYKTTSTGSTYFGCREEINVAVSSTTRDIICNVTMEVTGVILQGKGTQHLCTISISGAKPCDKGTFGHECENQCNCAKKNENCMIITGACPSGCADYYQGVNCLTACPLTTYGKHCENQCSSRCLNRHCDRHGTCLQCAPGLMGPLCDKECAHNTYGQNCSGTCSEFCAGNDTCDIVTGSCPSGCSPGYINLTCAQPCSRNLYGHECKMSCSQFCLANGTVCHHVTGACLHGCLPRFQGVTCEDCAPDYYAPPNCLSRCSRACAGTVTCDRVEGTCPSGCLPGYLGQLCDQTCGHNKYGDHCKRFCSPFCLTNEKNRSSDCDHISGVCLYGCYPGYKGKKCNARLTLMEQMSISVVFALLLILLALLTGICCLRRGTTKSTEVNEEGNVDIQMQQSTDTVSKASQGQRPDYMARAGTKKRRKDEQDAPDKRDIFSNVMLIQY